LGGEKTLVVSEKNMCFLFKVFLPTFARNMKIYEEGFLKDPADLHFRTFRGLTIPLTQTHLFWTWLEHQLDRGYRILAASMHGQ